MPECRKKGIGRATLQMLMRYGTFSLGITKFVAKINECNLASIRVFEKLGYSQTSYSSMFKEFTFELDVGCEGYTLSESYETLVCPE